MVVLFWVLNGVFIAALIVAFSASIFALAAFLGTLFRGAPYQPTPHSIVQEMIALAEIQEGERVADIGAGDGRIVIAFAKAGAEAHGFEVNPLLTLLARFNMWRRGVSGKAFVYQKNLWQQDFSSFQVVTIYGIGGMMGRLEEKLKQELPSGARIISHRFQFPGLEPSKRRGKLIRYDVRK